MSLANQLKQMSIGQILEQYPQTQTVFREFGLQAYAATEASKYENIEASALVNTTDRDALIAALVEAIEH
jgi:hypothetical protein